MAAQGFTYPFQKLKALEDHIEKRHVSFMNEFFPEYAERFDRICFMSVGLMVQITDDGETYFRYVEGSKFKRWLRGCIHE